MNQNSPASDFGLAYNLCWDLKKMRQGVSAFDRRDDIAAIFHTPLSVSHFPTTPTCPAHTVFTTANTLFLAIDGATLASQVGDFFNKAGTFSRRNLDFLNEGAYDAMNTVRTHVNSIITDPLIQVIYGYSFGGAMAQAYAITQDFQFTPGYVATCVSFGQPRTWQSLGGDVNPLGFSFARFNNRFDPLVRFPPHVDEAPTANALATQTVRNAWAVADHFGDGFTLNAPALPVRQMLPPLDQPIAELFLWSWFLSFNELQTNEHSIQRYYDNLLAIPEEGFSRSWEPLGSPAVIPPPPVEVRGGVMQPLERQALIDAAERTVAMQRGPEPETPPFYAIRRAGVWQCEYNGNFVAGGTGKRNAQAFARRMNAAWRQWWRSRIADNGNLTFAIEEAFPS